MADSLVVSQPQGGGGTTTSAGTQPGETLIGQFQNAVRGSGSSTATYKRRRLTNGGLVTSNPRFTSAPINPANQFSKPALSINPNQTLLQNPTQTLLNRGGALNAKDAFNDKAAVSLVLGTPANPQGVLATFNYFILEEIQMPDSERVDVVETFGAAHIFASGRFTRRYTFSGHMHTIPLTAKTGAVTTETVPPIHAWKSFYEQYLRATKSAQNGVFVQVTTPAGDIYSGYIVNFAEGRSSSSEFTTPFNFMMLVIDERDTWSSSQLFNNLIKPPTAQPSTVNQSELNVAVGDFSLLIQIGTTASAPSGVVDLGRISSDGTTSQTPEINLDCSHAGYVLTTTCDVPGIELQYGDGTPVSASQSRGGVTPIVVKVLDYSKVSTYFQANNRDSTIGISANISIANGAGQSATLTATFIASDKIVMEITRISFETANGNYVGNNLAVLAKGWNAYQEPAHQFVDALLVTINPKGSSQPLSGTPTATINARATTAFKGTTPVVASALDQSTDSPKFSGFTIADPGSPTWASGASTIRIPITLTAPSAVRDGSTPVMSFFSIDGVGATFDLTIESDLYETITTKVAFDTQMAPRGPLGNVIDPTLCTYATYATGTTTADGAVSLDFRMYAKPGSGVSPNDVKTILTGGTVSMTIAGNIYHLPITAFPSEIPITINSVAMSATIILAGPLSPSNSTGTGYILSIQFQFLDLTNAKSFRNFTAVKAAMNTINGLIITLGGNDPTSINVTKKS